MVARVLIYPEDGGKRIPRTVAKYLLLYHEVASKFV
jgi:hypothetical protein